MGVKKGLQSGKAMDKGMSKAQITMPLDIPDVGVLQIVLGERGELSSPSKVRKKEHVAANAGNGSRNCMGRMAE